MRTRHGYLYTPDGQVLPPNADVVEVKSAIKNYWQVVMDMGVKNVKLEIVEVEQHGVTAIEVGSAKLMADGNQVIDDAKYICGMEKTEW